MGIQTRGMRPGTCTWRGLHRHMDAFYKAKKKKIWVYKTMYMYL